VLCGRTGPYKTLLYIGRQDSIGIGMENQINKILNLVHKMKRVMTLTLLILILIIVAASVVELAVILYQEITDPAKGIIFLDIAELLNMFGFFFMILIGLELVETIEMYFKKNIIHAEIVLLIAVIAVARKVILLDLKEYDPLAIVGLALIILALCVGYFLIKKSYD